MRTYDPADHIRYVHLAPDPVVAPVPVHPAAARPALVLLVGGAGPVEAEGPAAEAPALRLAR